MVIANPPYVEFKNLHVDIKKSLKNFKTAKGKYDLYIPFIEISHKLTNSNGIFTLICPTRFLLRDYGKEIRRYIEMYAQILQIIDFSDFQVFENATNYTGVFILKNKKDNISYDFMVKTIIGNSTFNKNLNLLYSLESTDIIEITNYNSSILKRQVWAFNDSIREDIFGKVNENSLKLATISEGIYQGIASGKDEVFFVSQNVIEEYSLETEILYPLLKGKDISPYSISWSEKSVIYPYDKDGKVIAENVLSTSYPNIYKYLIYNKNKLAGRGYFDKSTKNWYELWNQRNLSRFLRDKIITLDNASKNSFTIDRGDFLGTTTVYSIILNDIHNLKLEYVLGVLNSKLLNFYHKNNTIPQAGGFYRYQAIFINDLPIKEASILAQQPIITLVNHILETKQVNPQSDTSALEVQIDQLVYELYGLTPEEIDIIEGN